MTGPSSEALQWALQYRKFVDGSILRVLRRPPLRASRARAFSRVDGFELLSFLSEGSSGTKKYSSGPGLLQHQKQMQVLVPPPMAVVGSRKEEREPHLRQGSDKE